MAEDQKGQSREAHEQPSAETDGATHGRGLCEVDRNRSIVADKKPTIKVHPQFEPPRHRDTKKMTSESLLGVSVPRWFKFSLFLQSIDEVIRGGFVLGMRAVLVHE